MGPQSWEDCGREVMGPELGRGRRGRGRDSAVSVGLEAAAAAGGGEGQGCRESRSSGLWPGHRGLCSLPVTQGL